MATTFVLTRPDVFVSGVVAAYVKPALGVPASGAPSGSAVSSPSVVGNSVTFTGLADNTQYIAYQGSPDRYVSFRTTPASSVVAETDPVAEADLATHAALTTTAHGGLIPSGLVDAKGDIIAASADNAVGRLAVGADGTALTADAASTLGVKWDTPVRNLVDAKGDLLAGTADNVLARLAAGTNGQVLTAQSGQAAGLQWAAQAGAPAEGAAFPGSPAASDIFHFLVDDTNGIEWAFRRNAANTKWRFIGGAALFLQVDTAETQGVQGTPTALTTPVSLTVPFTAIYEIEWGADFGYGASSAMVTYVSIDGATPTTLPHGCRGTLTASGSIAALSRKIRASVTTSVAHLYTNSSGTATFSRRWLSIRPVSVAT